MPYPLYAGGNLCYNLPMKLIIASNNAHKMREISEILGAEFPDMVTLKQAGLDIDVVEDGDTFQANAIKKAEEVLKASDFPAALADDSGLIVDALGGAPGVYSARYAGAHGEDGANNRLLLQNMDGVADRRCQFVCAMALALPAAETQVVTGECPGTLLAAPRGANGFGYDPLFLYETGQTFAEMGEEQKNAVSHRARAAALMREALKELL